jgi:hypothetical protein
MNRDKKISSESLGFFKQGAIKLTIGITATYMSLMSLDILPEPKIFKPVYSPEVEVAKNPFYDDIKSSGYYKENYNTTNTGTISMISAGEDIADLLIDKGIPFFLLATGALAGAAGAKNIAQCIYTQRKYTKK